MGRQKVFSVFSFQRGNTEACVDVFVFVFVCVCVCERERERERDRESVCVCVFVDREIFVVGAPRS